MSNINELVLEMMLIPGMLKPGQVVNLMSRPSKMQTPGEQGNWLNFQTKPGAVEPYTKHSNIRMDALHGRITNRQFIPTSEDPNKKKPYQVNWGLANQMGNWRAKTPELNPQTTQQRIYV